MWRQPSTEKNEGKGRLVLRIYVCTEVNNKKKREKRGRNNQEQGTMQSEKEGNHKINQMFQKVFSIFCSNSYVIQPLTS